MPAVNASGSKTQAVSGKGKGKQAQGRDNPDNDDSDDGDEDDEQHAYKKGKTISAREALSKTLEEEDHVEVHNGDKGRSLQEMRATYGSNFRLVADAASLKDALGNVDDCPQSVRPLLHYAMRKRGEGVSFTEIGEKFKYNSSLIFFQAKILIDNDLAVKFRANNGKSLVSWIVAKRYAHLCPNLADTTNGPSQDDDETQNGEEGETGGDSGLIASDLQLHEMSSEAVEEMLQRGKGSEPDMQDNEEEADLQVDIIDQGEEEAVGDRENATGLTTLHGLLAYPAASSRLQEKALIYDRSLVRLRILKLLKSSKNSATIRADLILRIGVQAPDRFDRKVFNATLRQLEKEELIERCLLKRPLHYKPNHTEQCWMATAKGIAHHDALTSSMHQRQVMKMRLTLAREVESSRSKLAVEASFVRQVLNSVESCGAAGTTIEQLNAEFGGSRDRHRDLDQMLSILKKPVNRYYSDYTIYSALEQSGRTRSQRFWTRRWRPSRLAPQEPREMEVAQLSSWMGLPGEKSFLNMDQWRQSRSEKPKAVKRDREDSLGDVDGSIVTKKAKKSSSGGPKGRPRKNFDRGAEVAAKRYQEKKAMREREEEERRGVETLLGEDAAGASVGMRKRKSRAGLAPVGTERGISTMSGQDGDQSDGDQEQSAMEVDPPPLMAENISIYLDPALPSSTVSIPATRTPASSAPTQPRASQASQKPINLTLQLKYDTLVEFFREKEIVEGSHFEYEYRKKIRSIARQGGDTQQYEMDRKVRNKLFTSLEKAGVIKFKKLAAPAMSKGPMRTVWYTPGIEEARLVAFCRQVSEGTQRPTDNWASAGGKREQAILDSSQIDAPDSFFTGMGVKFDFEAKTLEELLGNDGIRSKIASLRNVVAQYTGALPGLGARLCYLHTTVMEMINGSTESPFVQDGWTFDLRWWAKEATLGQYLKLALPSSSPTIMKASQDANLMRQLLKDVDENLLRALELHEGGEGCHKTMRPLMEYLGVFQLAEQVTHASEEQEASLTYRFAREGVIVGWSDTLELQRGEETYSFDMPMQAEQYWRRVTEHCGTMQPAQDLDELPVVQAELYDALSRKSAWYRNYRLLKPQQAFLYKTISLGVDRSVLDDADLLMRISGISVTPIHIVKKYYNRQCPGEKSKIGNSGEVRTSSRDGAFKTIRDTAKTDATPEEGATISVRRAKAIKRKALAVQRARVEEFNDAVRACFAALQIDESSRQVIEDGLASVRREYGKGEVERGEGGLTLKRMRQMFEDVIKLHQAGDQKWAVIVNRKKAPKKSTKAEEAAKKKDAPRTRKAAFEWTRIKDELLRDGVVILRCRDRHRNPANPTKNWKALNQIFPEPPANNLKARFDKLCTAVGEEAYLAQLEAEWDKLWTAHRGTDELEDATPKHPTDFDLYEHIQFLRTHINKLAVADKVDNETGDPLPVNAAKMLGLYDYERPPANESYDAYSSLSRIAQSDASVKGRAGVLRGHARTVEFNAIYAMQEMSARDDRSKIQLRRDRGRATALVKIVQCTPESEYQEDVATKLCRANADEETMDKAIKELLEAKVIKRRAKEEREVPNRSFVFGSNYVNFHQEETLETLPFWDIAKGYEGIVRQGQAVIFRQSENQETAAYLTLLSQNQVKAEMDLSVVEKIKMDKLFNAKTIQDSTLEIPVELHLGPLAKRSDLIKRCVALLDSQPRAEPVLEWCDGGADSLASRVDKVWKQWIASLRGEKQAVARLLESVFHDEAGVDGISKETLKTVCPSKHLKSLLLAAQGFSPPLIFQYGYEETLMISSRYLPDWTICFESGAISFPFKWYDIHGQWNELEWRPALQFVVHAIVTRPGITLAQLLVQFRIALDRMEVCRLVQFACEAGVVKKVLSYNEEIQGSDADWEARMDGEIALMAL